MPTCCGRARRVRLRRRRPRGPPPRGPVYPSIVLPSGPDYAAGRVTCAEARSRLGRWPDPVTGVEPGPAPSSGRCGTPPVGRDRPGFRPGTPRGGAGNDPRSLRPTVRRVNRRMRTVAPRQRRRHTKKRRRCSRCRFDRVRLAGSVALVLGPSAALRGSRARRLARSLGGAALGLGRPWPAVALGLGGLRGPGFARPWRPALAAAPPVVRSSPTSASASSAGSIARAGVGIGLGVRRRGHDQDGLAFGRARRRRRALPRSALPRSARSRSRACCVGDPADVAAVVAVLATDAGAVGRLGRRDRRRRRWYRRVACSRRLTASRIRDDGLGLAVVVDPVAVDVLERRVVSTARVPRRPRL